MLKLRRLGLASLFRPTSFFHYLRAQVVPHALSSHHRRNISMLHTCRMMRTIRFGLASALLLFVAAGRAQGDVITFENFAPPGGVVNVNPASPYSEAGFRLTPTNAGSAVFDAAAVFDMPGNTTDFFGFAEGNIITLTNVAGVPFNLSSLLLGPTTLAASPSVTITLVGNFAGGGSHDLRPDFRST